MRPTLQAQAAHWASWADAIPVLQQQAPTTAATLLQQLQNPTVPALQAASIEGVSRPYLKLLAAVYCNQTGDVNGKTFSIQRGVKQGDVITPLTQSRPSQQNCYGPQGTWEQNSLFNHHGSKQNCTKACSWDNHCAP